MPMQLNTHLNTHKYTNDVTTQLTLTILFFHTHTLVSRGKEVQMKQNTNMKECSIDGINKSDQRKIWDNSKFNTLNFQNSKI